MDHPKIVSREQWLAARKELLVKEKEHMRAGDRLSAERRALPWVKVEKEYFFDAPEGRKTLADLFAGCSQLIIHHLMFHPDWDAGCPGCSFQAEHIDGPGQHLQHHDVKIVSLAPHNRQASGLQAAHGLALRLGVLLRQRFQFRLSRVVSRRTRSPKAGSSTISGRSPLIPATTARNCPASACFTRIGTARSSIPIPPTREGSTPYSVGTTIST